MLLQNIMSTLYNLRNINNETFKHYKSKNNSHDNERQLEIIQC